MRRYNSFSAHKFLEIIITLYLGRLLFPLPFMYMPFPFDSHHFWAIVLFSSFLIFYPKAYIKKKLIPLYLFLAIKIIFTPLIWADRYFDIVGISTSTLSIQGVVLSYFPLFIALLIYYYYVDRDDKVGLGRICKRTWIFILLGVINSFIVSLMYPRAMIDSVRSGVTYDGSSVLETLKNLGFQGYGFFNALSSVFPIFIYYIMKTDQIKQKKIWWIALIFITWITIANSWVTAFLLFSSGFLLMAIFMKDNYKRDIKRLILVAILIIILPTSFKANIFYNSSEYFPDTKIGARLYDAGMTIEDPYIDYYQSDTHAGRRLGRTPYLWRSFLSNPLIGGGMTSGHVAWLDMLSVYGLLGFLPWAYLVLKNFRFNIRFIPQAYSGYYMLCIIAFVAMGFLKNTGGAHVYIFWFLIVPGSAFIYFRKNEEVNFNGI